MKKIMIVAALAATLTLGACGGKSDASREQISKGRDKAKEMLDASKTQQAKPAAKPETATPRQAAIQAPEAEQPDTAPGK